MFFIDDDESQIWQRCEHGGARADHDAGLAFADAMPFVETFALREVGVKYGDLIVELGKACFETADGLWGECDFRNKDEDGFAEIERGLSGLEVDFGFAAAGDAEEKIGRGRGWGSGRSAEGRGDLIEGLLLLVV